MADPTDRNDSSYSRNPDYVWSGGRWQYRGGANGGANTGSRTGAVDPNAPAAGGHVSGSSVPDPNGLFGSHGVLGDPNVLANDALLRRGIGSEIQNFAGYQDLSARLRAGAMRQQATNPYNAGIADQSRPAQLALIAQMRAGMDGPSLAGMQGQRAFAQNGQQALGAAAMGGANPRAAMLQSQQVGGGLAGDLGQARLAEVMRAQGSMGAASGALRGADLQSAGAQMGAGFQAQGINDQMARFYGSQGQRLDEARAQAEADNDRLRKQLGLDIAGKQLKMGTGMIGAGATAVSTAAGMGK